MDKTLRFNFAMPVWGERYIDVLLSGGLPSLLAEGNLPSFPWRQNSIFEFYTTRDSWKRIVESPVFKQLEQLMKVRAVFVDDELPKAKSKWTTLRYTMRESVESADLREAALFFVQPDQIWSDGSITLAGQRISEGYTAVMCPGIRTVEETLLPELRSRYLSNNHCSLTIPARDLVRFGVQYLHLEMYGWIWGSPAYCKIPSYILFPVKDEGFLAHCYILHPVVINAEVRHAPFRYIFDQDYLEAACPNYEKIYVSRSSDDIIHFEVSPHDAKFHRYPPRMHPISAMIWRGELDYNAHHRRFGKQPIKIASSGDGTSYAWIMTRVRAWFVVSLIELGWKIPDIALLIFNPENLIRRLNLRYRWKEQEISNSDEKMLARARTLAQIYEPGFARNYVMDIYWNISRQVKVHIIDRLREYYKSIEK